MKLHLDRAGAINVITALDADSVRVNQTRYSTSLIVLRERLVENWTPRSVADLVEHHFDDLAELGADIILLGTGTKLAFPHPRLAARLYAARIGLEVMDTGAACRTFNILAGEGRNVAAALILG